MRKFLDYVIYYVTRIFFLYFNCFGAPLCVAPLWAAYIAYPLWRLTLRFSAQSALVYLPVLTALR